VKGTFENFNNLLAAYKLTEPVSPEQQEYIIEQRRSDLKVLLKITGQLGIVFWLTVMVYEGLKSIGLKLTLIQCKIILGIATAAVASGSATGVYTGTKYIIKAIQKPEVKIEEKKEEDTEKSINRATGITGNIAIKKVNPTPAPREMTLYITRNIDAGQELQSQKSWPMENRELTETAAISLDNTTDQMEKDRIFEQIRELSPNWRIQTVKEIEGMVNSLDGRLITVVFDYRYKPYQLIIIELPMKNYETFIHFLRVCWNFWEQMPEKLPVNITSVRINLQIEQ